MCTRGSVVEVGHVLDLGQLGGDGFLPGLIGYSERGDAYSAPHIDVGFAGGILYDRTLARGYLYREALVCSRHIGLVQFFCVHVILLLPEFRHLRWSEAP